jgi:hypothetical protein
MRHLVDEDCRKHTDRVRFAGGGLGVRAPTHVEIDLGTFVEHECLEAFDLSAMSRIVLLRVEQDHPSAGMSRQHERLVDRSSGVMNRQDVRGARRRTGEGRCKQWCKED